MSLLNSASLVVTPNGYKASTLYSVIPNTTLGDMTVVRATTATRVNSAGLIESVANNVPRLDYSNGTCPSLLVEPQRTNLLTYSEQFDNAAWNNVRGVVTPNTTISPDGTQNADTFVSAVGQAFFPALTRAPSFVGNTNYSFSVFAKVLGNTNILRLSYVDNSIGYTGGKAIYNLATQVVTITQSPNASVTASMQSVGNGWYRLVLNFLTIATPTYNYSSIDITTNDVANAFALYGAQLEAGSYPTSYIPTTTAAVTRNADEISKTGISSLIGQTEGTIFIDFDIDNILSQTINPVIFSFSGTSYIRLFTTGEINYFESNSVIVASSVGIINNGQNKIAVNYKNNDFSIYANGVLVGSNNSGAVVAKSQIGLYYLASTIYNPSLFYNLVTLFPTKLTGAECISLTT